MNRGIEMVSDLRPIIPKSYTLKLTIDSGRKGLEAIFRPYQARLLERLWELNKGNGERVGVNSGSAHKWLLDKPEKKSRASVIFFLNDMVAAGILDFKERTGKGGYHRIYYPTMTETEFWIWFKSKVKQTLIEASHGLI